MTERSAAYATTPPWLSDVDIRLIQAVAIHRFQTAKDATYCHYEPSSHTYVRRRMSRLAGETDHANHYLYRFNQPHTGPGQAEKVFAVGSKGWELLSSIQGVDARDSRDRVYKLQDFSFSFLRHALLLSRSVAAATYWSRRQSDYTLVQANLSYGLAGSGLTSITVDDKTVSVIPDAFLCFERVADGARFPLLFEADCGTEAGRQLRQHARARLAYIQSPQYKALAKTSAGRICYLTIGQFPRYKESRRAAMQRWTQEILTELNMQHWASVFLFAACDYRQLYQAPLWDQPLWHHPDSQTPVSLFDPHPKENPHGDHRNLA